MKPLVQKLPAKSGVYLMKDKNGLVIYVGKARNLKARVRSYFSDTKSFKNQFLTPRIHQVDYILTDTEASAYLLEASLIKKHKPRYNVRLKDDKSYPYIRCSIKDTFPRFYMERRTKNKVSLYFGPYTEAFFVRRMIRFLNEQFKIRDCSNTFMKSRKKPCLTHYIGHCPAPCVQKVDSKHYLKQVKKALSFLKGEGQKQVLTDMKSRLQKLARKERFEEALLLRDRIKAIALCGKGPALEGLSQKNMDVWAFHTERASLLFHTLHIREGTLIGERFQYLSHSVKTSISQEMLLSVLFQYYMDNLLPDLILLPLNFTAKKSAHKVLFSTTQKNSKTLVSPLQGLSEIRGQPVEVRTPQSQVEKKLFRSALKKAHSHFKEQKSKEALLLKGLKEIQQKFDLKQKPFRMECFDVSHLQGQQMVASQVVFENGQPKKEDYRRYKIKKAPAGDDFASLHETLLRRLQHKEYPQPDLLLVDGGRGQLKTASTALKTRGLSSIPLVAIAKKKVCSDFASPDIKARPERFYLLNRKNALVLPLSSPALRILTHLRDEAHRFALSYHRARRSRATLLTTNFK